MAEEAVYLDFRKSLDTRRGPRGSIVNATQQPTSSLKMPPTGDKPEEAKPLWKHGQRQSKHGIHWIWAIERGLP